METIWSNAEEDWLEAKESTIPEIGEQLILFLFPISPRYIVRIMRFIIQIFWREYENMLFFYLMTAFLPLLIVQYLSHAACDSKQSSVLIAIDHSFVKISHHMLSLDRLGLTMELPTLLF